MLSVTGVSLSVTLLATQVPCTGRVWRKTKMEKISPCWFCCRRQWPPHPQTPLPRELFQWKPGIKLGYWVKDAKLASPLHPWETNPEGWPPCRIRGSCWEQVSWPSFFSGCAICKDINVCIETALNSVCLINDHSSFTSKKLTKPKRPNANSSTHISWEGLQH